MRSYLFQFIYSQKLYELFSVHQIQCMHNDVFPALIEAYSLEERTLAETSAQSGSEAVQLQDKLHVPLSLTSACPLFDIMQRNF